MIIILLTDNSDEDLLLLPLPGVIYQPSMTVSRMSFIIKTVVSAQTYKKISVVANQADLLLSFIICNIVKYK